MTCNSEIGKEEDLEIRLAERLNFIRHKIIVMSGKGGVGKSTIAVNTAVSLAASGKRVGILDVDFHGPSVPVLLGLQDYKAMPGRNGLVPAVVGGIKVMSIAFLLKGNDDAVIWRGPMKMGAIKQLLAEVEWGELDFLIIDSPPGTGDEPLSVCQVIKDIDGAVIVTTPQEMSLSDVRRSINFCRQLSLPILGVIENMSGFICPKCAEVINIFKTGGGEKMAAEMKVRFLGCIPLDPDIANAGDEGKAYIEAYQESQTASIIANILAPISSLPELRCF